jgi:hypothetical protein
MVCGVRFERAASRPFESHPIRERYGVEVFRRFFEQIVDQCQQAGLVWGRELYIDATKVQANASRDSIKPRFAMEAHLATLFATADLEAAEGME